MTALLEYIDFSVDCPKGSNYASNFFQNARNSSSNHYAQNYSGIIPASLVHDVTV